MIVFENKPNTSHVSNLAHRFMCPIWHIAQCVISGTLSDLFVFMGAREFFFGLIDEVAKILPDDSDLIFAHEKN